MEKDIYDIEAKPPAQSGPYSPRHTQYGIGDERLREMLQTFLADRFRLKVRRVTKTGPVYLLERGSKEFLPVPTKYTEDQPVNDAPGYSGEIEHVGGHWFLFNTSVSQLAKYASDHVLHKPVSDHTGIDGSFDYRDADAKIDKDDGEPGDSFEVFIRDIGLKIISSSGQEMTFVIEHGEKPSPN